MSNEPGFSRSASLTTNVQASSAASATIADDTPPPVTLARPFRSRKNRPCDGCRRAKTRCAIVIAGSPCVECQHTRKKCTFDEQPRERKRPVKRSLSPQELTIDAEQLPSTLNGRSRSKGNTASSSKRMRTLTSLNSNAVPHTSSSSVAPDAATTPMTLDPLGSNCGLESGKQPVSLEETRGYHVVTAVLTDDLLPVGARKAGCEGDEHIRQVSVDGNKPQYVIFSRKSEKQRQQQQKHHPDPSIAIQSALSLLQPIPGQRALLNLYLIHSNPAFPILPPPNYVIQSSSSSSSVYSSNHPYPPALLPKISTAALNHAPGGMYRSSVKTIRKLCQREAVDAELPRSSLSSLSDALFDISARPAGNAEDNYLVLAKALAQAQLLGLHIDPTNWGIPSWEKDLRRMLWWALRIHDGWASFLNSRPSHVQGNNHTVSLPTLSMILSATQLHEQQGFHVPKSNPSSSPSAQQAAPEIISGQHLPRSVNGSASASPYTEYPQHQYYSPPSSLPSPPQAQSRPPSPSQRNVYSAQSFLYLCRLSIIVSRLQTQVCTLMAPREDRLGRVMGIEKEIEVLLEEARELLGNGAGAASGFPSLMTCLLGLRCMARRIAIELSIGLGSPFTPDPETLERYAQAVEYISSLDGQAFDGFWLVHVGHILSSVTSSLIRLSLATTNSASTSQESPASSPGSNHSSGSHHVLLQVDARTNPIFVLCRLRSALQRARDLHHWDLADAALARADNVAVCLENVEEEEYHNVVYALRGTLLSSWQPVAEEPQSTKSGPGPVMDHDAAERAPGGGVDPGNRVGSNGSANGRGHANGNPIDAAAAMNWNIDLNLFGVLGLGDWSGFEGMPTTVGLSPDYGFLSS